MAISLAFQRRPKLQDDTQQHAHAWAVRLNGRPAQTLSTPEQTANDDADAS